MGKIIAVLVLGVTVFVGAMLAADRWMLNTDNTFRKCQYVETECPK
jgi:hypothetical protein